MNLLRLTFIFLFILMAASLSQAEPLAGLGTSFAFEYGANGHTLEARQPMSLRGGYRFESLDSYLEFSSFRSSQGNPALFVSRMHEEWLLWGRHVFARHWLVSPYAALGVGAQLDRVETSLGSEVSKIDGDPQSLYALAVGARTIFWKQLEMALEVRASYSSNYQPNPMLGFGLLAGWIF